MTDATVNRWAPQAIITKRAMFLDLEDTLPYSSTLLIVFIIITIMEGNGNGKWSGPILGYITNVTSWPLISHFVAFAFGGCSTALLSL